MDLGMAASRSWPRVPDTAGSVSATLHRSLALSSRSSSEWRAPTRTLRHEGYRVMGPRAGNV